jgi:hypothetical protein
MLRREIWFAFRFKFLFGAPIFGRKLHAPQIPGRFELDSYLEKIPDGLRPLCPGNAGAGALRLPKANYLDGNPRVMRKVMLGGITAAVKVVNVSAGSLFKWLA